QKVERVGNLNYPHGLSGSLLLDVALHPDGNIESIDLRRSSGTPELDRAAIEIVKLAAPFAPFPERIAAETDILHIVRTWQFGGQMK
ncbi:MAG: energy transducer TonB family protein, partial [Gammaproteobacteria bacterium]